MALLRSIEHSDPYMERLGQYFEASRIVGEENVAKRWSTFLSVVGPGLYKLLRSIMQHFRFKVVIAADVNVHKGLGNSSKC